MKPLRQRFQHFGPTGIHNWFQQVLWPMGGDWGKEQKAHAHMLIPQTTLACGGSYLVSIEVESSAGVRAWWTLGLGLRACSIPKYTVVWGPRWYHMVCYVFSHNHNHSLLSMYMVGLRVQKSEHLLHWMCCQQHNIRKGSATGTCRQFFLPKQ